MSNLYFSNVCTWGALQEMHSSFRCALFIYMVPRNSMSLDIILMCQNIATLIVKQYIIHKLCTLNAVSRI